MKRSLVLLTLCCFVCPINAIDRIPIAVNPLQAKNVDQTDVDIITDRLCVELTNVSTFTVLERSQISEVLKEQGFQQTGSCSEEACVVQIGQLLGVQVMVTGSIGYIGQIYTLNVRMINIQTGQVVSAVTEDYQGSIQKVLLGMRDIAGRFEKSVLLEKYGSLEIKTNPSGASVIINGKEQGKTPWRSNEMLPENQTLVISLKGYESVKQSVEIATGKLASLTFKLAKAGTESDSAKNVKHDKPPESRKKHQLIRRIAFGSLSALSIGAGIYCNSRLVENNDKMTHLKETYSQATTGFDKYRSDYSDVKEAADKNALLRNIFYGASGAFALGLVVSIPF